MNKFCTLIAAFVVSFSVTLAGLFGVANAAPSLEAFAKDPAIDNVSLSPDGRHIVALQYDNGKQIVAIYDVSGSGGAPYYLAMPDKYGEDLLITNILWANNNRFIVQLRFPDVRYGTPLVETRMMAANIDGSNVQVIPKIRKQEDQPQIQDRIYDMLPDDPDHVLLALQKWGDTEGLRAYKLNVNNGHMDKLSSSYNRAGVTEGVYWYQADHQGVTRLRYSEDDGRTIVEHRRTDNDRWEVLFRSGVDEELEFRPVEFALDPDILYVKAYNEAGYLALYSYSVSKGEIGSAVFSRDDADVDDVRFSRNQTQLIGYIYDSGSRHVVYTDPTYKAVSGVIDNALAGISYSISSADLSGAKYIVHATDPQHPGTFFLLDLAKSSFSKVGDEYPDLAPSQLARVEARTYKARDGLEIQAIVTIPNGKGPFPMVVYPHGGPHSRDTVHYHSVAQFLASRGYVVLQPNFRGSTGFGEEFMMKGHQAWGLEMQDDITDGAEAMIKWGLADPNRICIMGGSYGGYAALMGAIKTPDLYRCAVAFAPVTSVDKMLSEQRLFKFWQGSQPSRDSSWSDGRSRRDVSPVNNVDAIKIPILLIHGEKDRVVNVSHSKMMASRLNNAGKTYRLVLLEHGNHYRSREEDRLRYFQEVEAFLKKYLN